MTEQPRTKAECLEQALEWGTMRSHHNLMLGLEPGVEGENRQRTLVYIAQADAAEVARLAALYQMLPDEVVE